MSNLPLDIARRYLFAKKSQNVINIISGISAMGVMVATAALIIVLSVFNGLNGLVTNLFGSFDADLKISAAEGKTFKIDSLLRSCTLENANFAAAAEVVEDHALVKNGRRQMPATILGVSPSYANVTDIANIVIDGQFQPNQCLLGGNLADQLGVSSVSFFPSITFFAPKRYGKVNMQNPESSFIEVQGRVSGAFLVQQIDYDATYIISGINMARELFCFDDDEVTSIVLKYNTEASNSENKKYRKELEEQLGPDYVVKDKWQQHESFFKMMEVEKFMSFFILLFIVLIAAFNIIGSLSMLIFEKRESISVLRSLGADENFTTRVFLFEGWLVSIGGALLGLVLGVLLVLAQEKWSIITFGDADSYIISAYPVQLLWSDVLLVFVAVVVLAALAAWYPVKTIVRRYYRAPQN